MTLSKRVASQLGNPSGMFGKIAGLLWNRRNAALNDTAFDSLDLEATDRVLDIGFGGGYLLNWMLSVTVNGLVAGVDISPEMVSHCAKRYRKIIAAGRLDLKCAPAESLPYPDKSFTKACSVNSIFYWKDVQQGIAEMHRVLVDGGMAVLCFTCKASLEKKGFSKNIRLFEAGEIEGIMKQHGFQDIKTASFSDKYRQYVCITGQKQSDAVF